MTQQSGPCRSAIIVAIGRLEESLRHENPSWRELEALDAAGPLIATVERRMDLAEALAGDPLYLARAKLIEALICLEPPKVMEPEAAIVQEAAIVIAPAAVSPPELPAEQPAPAVPLAARITPLGALAPADDLTRIRGIDAETAARLAAVGVQTFRDISNWTAADVARVTAALDLGRRLHRENWIEQAAMLAMARPDTTATAVEPPASHAGAVPEPRACETPLAFSLDVTESAVHFDEPVAANNNEPPEMSGPIAAEIEIEIEATQASHAPLPERIAETVSDRASTVLDEIPAAFDVTAFAFEEEAGLEIVAAAPRAPETQSENLEQRIERLDRVTAADVLPALATAPAPAPAHPVVTPHSSLARLLAQRAEARARKNAGRDETAADELDSGLTLDVPEADVKVVIRKGRSGVQSTGEPAPARVNGLQDEHAGSAAPSAGEQPDGDWSREASVEIVNPRRAIRTQLDWRNAPPPAPESPRPSRFFKALKGE